jgi:proline iminopeptidase
MSHPIPAPRASGLTKQTATPLHWAAYGPRDAERLVLLHGGPGASYDYLLPQMLALADQYHLLFYDQRGGGRSRTDDSEEVTWEIHVADLAAIVREFQLERVSLVGYSWGALLALLYSMRALEDERLVLPARLVLISPAPIRPEYRRAFDDEFARRQRSEPIATMRSELQRSGLQESDRDAYRQRAFELSVAGYFSDPEKAVELTPFRVIGKVQQSVWRSLGDFDVTTRLAGLSAPALVVHGRDDPVPLASSEQVARALRAKLLLLADSGHVPYVEQPEKLFTAVNRFLAETDWDR